MAAKCSYGVLTQLKSPPLLFFVLILSLNMSSSNGFIRLFPRVNLLYFIVTIPYCNLNGVPFGGSLNTGSYEPLL